MLNCADAKSKRYYIAAIKFGISQLREGMSQPEFSSIIDDAQRKLGGSLILHWPFWRSFCFSAWHHQAPEIKEGRYCLDGLRMHGGRLFILISQEPLSLAPNLLNVRRKYGSLNNKHRLQDSRLQRLVQPVKKWMLPHVK